MPEVNENTVEESTVKSEENVVKNVKKAESGQSKPVIAKTNNHSNVRFVILECGQGGASIGETLAACLPNKPFSIAINTSSQDLDQVDLPDNQKFKIGGESISGAGKNRNRAKTYFKNFAAINPFDNEKKLGVLETILGYYEEILFHPTIQTIIIVSFSSDGGTGSGIGPMLTANLANYMNLAKSFHIGGKEYEIDDTINSVPRPVVIGITPKCNVTAGATNLANTIECFLDIQKSIDAGLGHFFIADNNLDSSIAYSSTEEMYNIINARIATPLLKFLGIEINSGIKCMDLQDKVNTLRICGCSAFTSITIPNQYQYVLPHGQSVTRTVMVLKNDEENPGNEEKAAATLIRKLDISSVDTIPVFFDLNKTGINVESMAKDIVETSMIGFFGFKSLNAIVEDLRDSLHRVQMINDKKASILHDNALGFSTIKEDSEELDARFGSGSVNPSAVNDLF